MDGVRILAQLDRVYMFRNKPSVTRRKILSYKILRDNPWSDHHPVITMIELQDGPSCQSRWKINAFWLKLARGIIEAAWRSVSALTLFMAKLKVVSRTYQAFCKRKVVEFRAEENQSWDSFVVVSLELHQSPDDPILQRRQAQLR